MLEINRTTAPDIDVQGIDVHAYYLDRSQTEQGNSILHTVEDLQTILDKDKKKIKKMR